LAVTTVDNEDILLITLCRRSTRCVCYLMPWNSGNSSRNSTPRWARDTSPGRVLSPPPTSAGTGAE